MFVLRREIRDKPIIFKKKDMSKSKFKGNWKGMTFIDCSMYHCDFSEAKMKDCVFVKCRMMGAKFTSTTLTRSIFDRCDLAHCVFGLCSSLHHVEFKNCDLWCASLLTGYSVGTDFSGSYMTGASLHRATFLHSKFDNVEMYGYELIKKEAA